MKIVYIAAALSLVSFPALAQVPAFSCQITGSDKSGLRNRRVQSNDSRPNMLRALYGNGD